MPEWLTRTQALIGEDAISLLQKKTVAVLGLGGVGGSAAEALCRSGVGKLILVDRDTVSRSNLNRQLFATCRTIGQKKVEAATDRLLSICPDCQIADTTNSTRRKIGNFYFPKSRILSLTPLIQ